MATAITISTALCSARRYSKPATGIASRVRGRASSAMAAATDVLPAIIVGGGRVGKALESMGNGQDVLVGRGEVIPVDFDGPIFVCTRNDDLEAVLQATPSSRWDDLKTKNFVLVLFDGQPVLPINIKDMEDFINIPADLVFFQNGMLDPWFESKGLKDANQVLAYFAISKLGEPPIDGKTDTDPEGLTAAFGKWASAVATRLHSGGLSCKVLDKDAFQKQMLEKLIWISAFMLVGARHPGATVGIVEKEYRAEVASLIAELAAAAAAERSISFEEAIEERLCAYSRAVAHFPTAVKEFKWRNGWFYSLTQKAISNGKPDPCPLHTTWLQELKVV